MQLDTALNDFLERFKGEDTEEEAALKNQTYVLKREGSDEKEEDEEKKESSSATNMESSALSVGLDFLQNNVNVKGDKDKPKTPSSVNAIKIDSALSSQQGRIDKHIGKMKKISVSNPERAARMQNKFELKNQKQTQKDIDGKGGGKGAGWAAAASALGTMIPAQDQSEKAKEGYLTEEEYKGSQTQDGVKDAVASAVPLAGIFRGVEKGGAAVAQGTGGDQHATIASSMFDPIGGAIQTVKDDDLNTGDKVLGVAAAFVAPWATGNKLSQTRRDRKIAFQKEQYDKKTTFEKKKLEEQYRMEQGLLALESTKALRKRQLGLIS